MPGDGAETESIPTLSSSPPEARCANCGAGLLGPYCFECGQRVTDFHRSVWRLLAGFLDNAFGWDNKLLLSLRSLLQRPGLLTREFLLGHRVRYVDPLRQFLVVSAIGLAVLQFVPSAVTFTSSKDAPAYGVDAATLEKAAKEAEKKRDLHSRWDAWIERVKAAVETKVEQEGSARFTAEIWQQAVQRASWVTLAVLPIFALLLRGMYWGKDSYYFGHLIFSLHYHTFLVLFGVVYLSLVRAAPDKSFNLLSAVVLILTLWPPVYLYSALRRVYGEGRVRTLLKTLFVGFLHWMILLIGITVLEVITVVLAVS